MPPASAKPDTLRWSLDPTEPCVECSRFPVSSAREWGEYY